MLYGVGENFRGAKTDVWIHVLYSRFGMRECVAYLKLGETVKDQDRFAFGDATDVN